MLFSNFPEFLNNERKELKEQETLNKTEIIFRQFILMLSDDIKESLERVINSHSHTQLLFAAGTHQHQQICLHTSAITFYQPFLHILLVNLVFSKKKLVYNINNCQWIYLICGIQEAVIIECLLDDSLKLWHVLQCLQKILRKIR